MGFVTWLEAPDLQQVTRGIKDEYKSPEGSELFFGVVRINVIFNASQKCFRWLGGEDLQRYIDFRKRIGLEQKRRVHQL